MKTVEDLVEVCTVTVHTFFKALKKVKAFGIVYTKDHSVSGSVVTDLVQKQQDFG